jgi:biopolymer transport protein ExbB
VFDLMNKGGIIMYLILALSVTAVAIIIERLLYYRKIRVDEEALLTRLKAALQKGHYDEALSICDGNPSPITNLMKVGIEHRDQPRHVIREAILDAANLETPLLEKHLSALGTVAYIAPLLGLLGTVMGNIRAFGVLAGFESVGDPTLLAQGISEALLTTAAGIIVSIPTVIFYNAFVSRVNHAIVRLETRVNALIRLLGVGGSD